MKEDVLGHPFFVYSYTKFSFGFLSLRISFLQYPDFSCFRIFLCYDRDTKENRGR